MPDALNPQVADILTIENAKTVAGQSAASNAMLSQISAAALGLAVQNSVAAQQVANQNMLDAQSNARAQMTAIQTLAVNNLLNVDPAEAASLNKLLTGDEIAQKVIAGLTSVIAGQVGSKVAGNTPPATPAVVAPLQGQGGPADKE